MRELVGQNKPFHSAIDRAAGLLKRRVGTGAEFMKELMALQGIKQSEITERGLGEIMGMPKMTHEQFMDELGKRPVSPIQEKVLGEQPSKQAVRKKVNDIIRRMAEEYASKDSYSSSKEYRYLKAEELRRMRDQNMQSAVEPEAIRELTKAPYHGEYTLPGGDNYREMLIKAPHIYAEHNKLREQMEKKYGPAGANSDLVTPEDKKLWSESINKTQDKEPFHGVSAHFGGEKNILASMRLKDRLGPNGEKLLHLEELQSDWHQQGREKGYENKTRSVKDIDKDIDLLLNELRSKPNVNYSIQEEDWEKYPEISARFDQLSNERALANHKSENVVPDAPFKKNWEEMALKRLIHHAAEKGYHGIVVTPGAEQADRYSLAKHIDRIELQPNEFPNKDTHPYYFIAFDKNQKKVVDDTVTPEKLESYIGKDLANKILSMEPNKQGERYLDNANLTTGGEGMKAFYDKKIPNILNAIGKKYGVKTQLHGHSIPKGVSDFNPNTGTTNPNQPQAQLHHFPITEEMRKDILANGLPLYSGGGDVHKAKGGSIIKELEAYIKQREGQYGLNRLQRAADEIPNLENMYTLQALKEAFGGDNAKALMTMDPADFERFAAPLIQRSKTTFSPNQTSIDKHSLPTDEYIQHLARIKGFSDVPFLSANKEEQGLPLMPYISGHEGRHRSRALAKMGKTKNLVRLIPSSELREPFPRRSREEYIQALKNELAMTKNMVLPEAYKTSQTDSKIRRPAIELPEIYKDGGEVDAESYFFPNKE